MPTRLLIDGDVVPTPVVVPATPVRVPQASPEESAGGQSGGGAAKHPIQPRPGFLARGTRLRIDGMMSPVPSAAAVAAAEAADGGGTAAPGDPPSQSTRRKERAYALHTASAIRKPEDFAIALLTYMGLPINRTNVQALLQWESSEGTFPVPARHYLGDYSPAFSGYHNPLNTGFLYAGVGPRTPNSSRPNRAAAEYPSWTVGLRATAFSLSERQYRPIFNVLRAASGGRALETAVHASTWGTGVWSTAPRPPYAYKHYRRSPFFYAGG
jgi:hypothetical protein